VQGAHVAAVPRPFVLALLVYCLLAYGDGVDSMLFCFISASWDQACTLAYPKWNWNNNVCESEMWEISNLMHNLCLFEPFAVSCAVIVEFSCWRLFLLSNLCGLISHIFSSIFLRFRMNSSLVASLIEKLYKFSRLFT